MPVGLWIVGTARRHACQSVSQASLLRRRHCGEGYKNHWPTGKSTLALTRKDGLDRMKRSAVLKTLMRAAKSAGLSYSERELRRHTAVTVGSVTRTLGRHSEIDDVTARKFFDQFADVLGGRGWWR